MSKRLAIVSAIISLFVVGQAGADFVYTGADITFTKADFVNPLLEVNQDRITPNVWITRGDSMGIFNAAVEGSYSSFFSPQDTEWAFSGINNPTGATFNAANFSSLTFTDWETSIGAGPGHGNIVGRPAVVHLITDDHYIDITFTSWTEGGSGGPGMPSGGGFSYTRATVPEPSAFLYGGLISVLAGCGYRIKRRLA